MCTEKVSTPNRHNIDLGASGEGLARKFLKKLGYSILFNNYRSYLGEIDIVARDKDTICFIEVKTRSNRNFGLPQEAVTRRKQRQLTRLAAEFLKENNLSGQSARFDVVSVILPQGGLEPEIEIFKNAFSIEE